jgi:hypothetical protein
VHRTTRWLDLGLGYREQWEQTKDNKWFEENRPFVNATLKWKMWGIPFSDRNQMEWRTLEGRPNEVRYRNKVTATSTARWTAWQIHPYVSDEFFFDNESKELLKDRVSIGLKGQPTDRLSADVFALWESSDTSLSAKDKVYVAGVKLLVTF